MYNWLRFKCNPCLPLGENGRRITGCDEHINLSRKAAGEGMVLLKNEANILPFSPKNHIALFGKASTDYVKGGGGSVFWARNGNKNWADKYKNELRSAVQNAKGYFIDFATLPTDKVLDVNIDGSHPTVEGHKLIGEKLCEFFGLL